MSVDRFRVEIEGAGPLAQRIRRASRAILPVTGAEMRGLAPRLTRLFQGVAPRRSGRLSRSIASNMIGPTALETTSTARSDEGYPYTGVTRIGHRVAYIYPRKGRALKITLPSGEVIFRARVRGSRPTHDWASRGFRPAERAAEESGRRIGRQIAARI